MYKRQVASRQAGLERAHRRFHGLEGAFQQLWKPRQYAGIVAAHTQRQVEAVSYTHLRAHETVLDLVCRPLLETKNTKNALHLE